MELLAESQAVDDEQNKGLISVHKEAEELLALFGSISWAIRYIEKT